MLTSDIERRAEAIAHSDLDVADAFLVYDELLRERVPYGVAVWSTQDPATGLFTSCTMSGLPKDATQEAHMFVYEFRDDEPATIRSLIADDRTVAILSDVTGGDLNKAGRYRGILAAFGVTDEMRSILSIDGTTWGAVSLNRFDGRFCADEAKHMAALAPYVADTIRTALLRAAAIRPEAVDDPPGILEARPDGSVVSMTAPAQRWLDIGGEYLTTTANACAAAIRERSDWPGARARLPLADGRLLSLNAASMTERDGSVAVIVSLARPAEVSAALVDAYGLTARQRDVLGLLLLGRSMISIARQLGISEHTAHDHRKALYRRVGVSSRSELAALLQAEQYDARLHRGDTPSPYGGFLEN